MHEVSRCGDNGPGIIFIVICQDSMVTDSGVRSQRLGVVETTGAGVSGVTPGVVTVTTSPRPRVETRVQLSERDKHDGEHLLTDMKDGVYL